ncbi:MAG TPA: hypothetical protein VER98_13265 [Terriglobia bacterium]|nr:hypothetical protein [Terriglobia bacterium]
MQLSHRTILFAVAFGLLGFCQQGFAARLVLVAGGGDKIATAPALESKFDGPFGVDFDRAGNMFIIEMTGNRLRKMESRGIISIVAGNGEKGDTGDGGPAGKAQFNGPHHIAVLPSGDVLVPDTWNNRVRKIDARSGLITTIIGTGKKGSDGDGGPAIDAAFGGLYCAALDSKGERVYLADLDNRRVRMVDLKSGKVTTVAGNGKKGVPKDRAEATDAPLLDPRAVAVDRKGNIYILERGGNALRVVDPSGKISTVAGNGQKGATGDGGDALQATLNGPKHLCVDLEENVIIADTENHLIRKFLPRSGKIVRVAGSGKRGTHGIGGPAEEAELNQPHGVYVHPSGTLYISDSSNNRILKLVQ